jgi:hypothetical protein
MTGQSIKSPQKQFGEEAVARITKRIDDAIATICREIQAHSAETGQYVYPQNKGRLTRMEVLRRASVDKKTLLAEYHANNYENVAKFVVSTNREIISRVAAAKRVTVPKQRRRADPLSDLAQENEVLRRLLKEARDEIAALQERLAS